MPVNINSAGNIAINSAGKVAVNYPGTWIMPFNASFSTNDSPDGNNTGVNLGVQFRSDQPGYIKQIRFWKTTGNTGTHVGSLWLTGASGTVLLNQITFTNESAVGWQYATFSAATFISANTSYVASIFVPLQQAPNVFYMAIGAWWLSTNAVTQYLRTGSIYGVYGDGPFGPNGLFTYGGSSVLPTSTFNNTYYGVDIFFDNNA